MRFIPALLVGVLAAINSVAATALTPRAYYKPECDAKAAKTPFLVFNPPTLSIEDKSFDTEFTVALASKPTSNVVVYLDSSSGLKFKNAVLTFTPDNWNVPQAEKAVPQADYYSDTKDTTVEIVAQVDAPCEPYNACQQKYTGKRKCHKAQTCHCTGDPHCTSFDDHYYTPVTTGCHHHVQSDYLNIQTYHYPCTWPGFKQMACIGAVAIEYHESVAVVSIANKDYTSADLNSGKPKPPPICEKISGDFSHMQITPDKFDVGSNDWQFELDDGSTIHIIVNNEKGMSWMDLHVNLHPGYAEKVTGVCNKYDDGDGHLYDANGGKCSPNNDKDVKKFTQSWKVAAEDNLFHKSNYKGSKKHPYGTAYTPCHGVKPQNYTTVCSADKPPVPQPPPPPPPCNPPPYNPGDYNHNEPTPVTTAASSTAYVVSSTTASTKDYANSSQGYTTSSSSAAPPATTSSQGYTSAEKPPATTQTYSASSAKPPATSSSPVPTTPVYAPSDSDSASAQKHCLDILNVPCCNSICASKYESFLKACIEDILATGSYLFAETTRRTYNSYCNSVTSNMGNHGNSTAYDVAQQCKSDAGHGDNQCPNSCSDHGVCTAYGCQCVAPYSGTDCSINQQTLPSVTPYGDATKDNTVMAYNGAAVNASYVQAAPAPQIVSAAYNQKQDGATVYKSVSSTAKPGSGPYNIKDGSGADRAVVGSGAALVVFVAALMF